jgi:hypothetical protein
MASEQKFKIWKCTNDSASGFMVTPDSIVMAGTSKNFIVIDQNGTNIAGPISFMTTSDQIRQGGLFIQMNDFVKMIPGTMVTPIPQQIPFPPVALIASVAESLPFLLAMMV